MAGNQLQSQSASCAKRHENSEGGRTQEKRCRNNGDERKMAVRNETVQSRNSYRGMQAKWITALEPQEHLLLFASSIASIFFSLFIPFFLNAAIHLSFALSIPPSFPVSPLLWVTDTQGKMCVCRCVQAGCCCHQEQSHLLPNTRCAADRKTGQGGGKKKKKNIFQASTAQHTLLFSCTENTKM